ncbi:transcription termination/antitermination protein NusG [Corynebacterium silvaticum]|uniref:Transcription termination/antitermination protein NusG n=1 Tax=Corynebacterium silvaticum TaxID=2320431 RepID=A0A7Y4LIA5_9CORY|nr:transcription termination/antitermination protein NusG [Corynebacterium silvaticum]ARU45471.1 transcription termination/antitermination protein NusG [Corynebacterium silvaticum]MBH5300048.1 transcription termination/antitermination protein NusG [Corynebacterium silvaticum]NOM65427.1 transcription termination/antitermination protein NusG [Corynebacterium silvaticum]NON70584.1 transcription termination/antitermination protein NusG [Corynebacterium silvaticum]TFA92371.1 transcription terminati
MSDENNSGSFAEAFDDAVEATIAAETEAAEAAPELDEAVEQPVQEVDAEAALAGAVEDGDAEYKARLRKYTRELKKLPGSWYIIQCYSGYENKVKTNLDMRAQTLEVEDSIFDVVVPIEQAVELRDGKRKLVKRKLLPGYVLVRMDINDRSWSVVRDTPGVTSFVGNEGNATPVKHRDVAKFLIPQESVAGDGGESNAVNAEGEKVVAMPGASTKPKVEVDFQVGEAVTILSGALASVSATISAIDTENNKLQALVSIFGRETPVELNFDQVEKVS